MLVLSRVNKHITISFRLIVNRECHLPYILEVPVHFDADLGVSRRNEPVVFDMRRLIPVAWRLGCRNCERNQTAKSDYYSAVSHRTAFP